MTPSDGTSVVLAEREGMVVTEIARTLRVDEGRARAHFEELAKFLAVAGATDEALCPPRSLDPAWHTFILHTRAYASHCQSRLGRFVHHDAGQRGTPAMYARTHQLVTARYGALDATIWPDPATVRDEDLPDCRQAAP